MSWKKFVYAGHSEDKKEDTGEAKTSFESKFPERNSSSETKTVVKPVMGSTPITPDNPMCAPHMDKILNMYQVGFESLNMEGFDFFEFYKMVIEGGIDDPKIYTMGFSMAKQMGATKETLLSQSQFYIDEIQKVHKKYVDAGNQKMNEEISSKTNEETSLRNEVDGIDAEIKRLTTLKAEKEIALQKIDGKYSPSITEIECKLMANETAMERIVGSIQRVVQGVKNNI